MDYATSLSEAQQQLLAQYQQHLQQQQQQQPQQQPQQASQAYDPTQLQSYDSASQAYYPYHQAYQTPVAHHQHPQQYPYYTPDYGASATAAAAAASNAYQADPALQAHDPSAVAPQYYTQDQQAAYNASLNPAAAAAVHALSQLTQFAGTMDAAERAVAEQQWSNGGAGQVPPQQAQVQHAGMVHPHAGGGPYRGGGRRGGGSFRGGKGNFGHRHQRQDGGSFRGRGRARGGGGGRRFPHSAPEVQVPYPVHAAEAPQPYVEPGTVYEPSQVAMPDPGRALVNASSRRTPTVIFCELCRVECNSGEIFEKHKIGKRHKKNLQRLEELEHQKKLTAEADTRQRRSAAEAELQQKIEQPEHMHFDGENATTSQDAGVTDTANEITVEGGQPSQMVEQPQTPKGDMFNASAKKRKRDNIKKTPLKRKTSFVQDGKRMRVEPSRPEAPKELPVHCALCNVTCDTMAVFQCHLSGKKHTSRVKRSQIQTIAYVPPTGVALYIPFGAGYGQRPPPPAVSEPVSQEDLAPITFDHQATLTEPASQQLPGIITIDCQAAASEPVTLQVSATTAEGYQDAAAGLVDQDIPMVGSEGQNTDLEHELKDVDGNDTLIPITECGDQPADRAIPTSLSIEAEEPSSGMELQ